VYLGVPLCRPGRSGRVRDAAKGDTPAGRSSIPVEMALGDLWNRTLVYFGIAEEDEWDDDSAAAEELERSYEERRANVRRLAPRRREREPDDWTESTGERPPTESRGRLRRVDMPPPAGPAPASVHLVVPRSFNDAQQIADKFKQAIPVILNLQGSDAELSKRLIDFASGLTYALEGGMQRVADKVFLLTPRNVEVSAEERARWLEGGGFFNQA
jgi:cell division inhibitor SepF